MQTYLDIFLRTPSLCGGLCRRPFMLRRGTWHSEKRVSCVAGDTQNKFLTSVSFSYPTKRQQKCSFSQGHGRILRDSCGKTKGFSKYCLFLCISLCFVIRQSHVSNSGQWVLWNILGQGHNPPAALCLRSLLCKNTSSCCHWLLGTLATPTRGYSHDTES